MNTSEAGHFPACIILSDWQPCWSPFRTPMSYFAALFLFLIYLQFVLHCPPLLFSFFPSFSMLYISKTNQFDFYLFQCGPPLLWVVCATHNCPAYLLPTWIQPRSLKHYFRLQTSPYKSRTSMLVSASHHATQNRKDHLIICSWRHIQYYSFRVDMVIISSET